jgi:hypothetical protein
MKQRYNPLTDEQTEQIIHLFRTEKENSTPQIVKKSGFSLYHVEKAINKYLQAPKRKRTH